MKPMKPIKPTGCMHPTDGSFGGVPLDETQTFTGVTAAALEPRRWRAVSVS